MDDHEIVDLYWQRDEHAIEATAAKYESYCMKISQNILSDRADSEEVERVLESIAAAGFECEPQDGVTRLAGHAAAKARDPVCLSRQDRAQSGVEPL